MSTHCGILRPVESFNPLNELRLAPFATPAGRHLPAHDPNLYPFSHRLYSYKATPTFL